MTSSDPPVVGRTTSATWAAMLRAEAPVALSELAPYPARGGASVPPGCYGVSHGSGLLSELVRHATDSWAGHAFVHVGNGQIVEATAPVARVAAADSHPDAVWNVHEPLTDTQRLLVVARAHALVGTRYDWPAHVGFALEILKLDTPDELDPVFRQGRWRVCSALVADCYAFAGISLDTGGDPNLVSPADLYNRIAEQQQAAQPRPVAT
jgi:hypothetical protein